MSEEIMIDQAGNPQPPAAAVPVPVTPPPQTTPTPAASGENWQVRFSGLQKSLQETLQTTGWNRLDAIPKQADVTTWQQAATELPNLRAQYEATVQEKIALETEKTVLTARAAQLERQARKFSLVAEKAPQAVALAEYIPDAPDDDAQVAAISKFLAQLGSTIQPAAVGKLPPSLQPSTGGTNLTAVDVFAQMTAALTGGNTAEYERLREVWATLP